jgi:hypothetical protein
VAVGDAVDQLHAPGDDDAAEAADLAVRGPDGLARHQAGARAVELDVEEVGHPRNSATKAVAGAS